LTLDFEGHCAEIVTQTSLLIGHLAGADVSVPVPSCPGWNVSQLARHVDGGQRWAREIVATRASEPPSDIALRDLSAATNDNPDALAASLAEAAKAAAVRRFTPGGSRTRP
jgi:Mycothiol maleylpyruvate isomerase N-terminal domain